MVFLRYIILAEEIGCFIKFSILLSLNELENIVNCSGHKTPFGTLSTLERVGLATQRRSKKKDSTILAFNKVVNYGL